MTILPDSRNRRKCTTVPQQVLAYLYMLFIGGALTQVRAFVWLSPPVSSFTRDLPAPRLVLQTTTPSADFPARSRAGISLKTSP